MRAHPKTRARETRSHHAPPHVCLYSLEHGIQPDGQMPSDKTIGGGDDAFNGAAVDVVGSELWLRSAVYAGSGGVRVGARSGVTELRRSCEICVLRRIGHT